VLNVFAEMWSCIECLGENVMGVALLSGRLLTLL